MPLVAGIDSSTQSTKVEVRDFESGELVATGRAPHPATTPPCSEQDPKAWWEALLTAFGQVGPLVKDIAAVSVAGQQHGLVVLDSDHQPLRDAKLWNDTESAQQAERLTNQIGADAWAAACGSVPVASFTVTKLAWLVQHHSALVPSIAKVLLPHDYLNFCLTGEFSTDRGDASGTGWFDGGANRYRDDLLALVGGRDDWPDLLPPVCGPVEPAGAITAAAAEATGLPQGIAVGPGTGDNMAAALGLGLTPGDVVISIGTSGVAYAASTTPTMDPTGQVAGFSDATGGFLPLVCTLNATKVTDTVARWLGLDQETFAAAALTSCSGANGVRLTPYFDGERTPNQPDATGTFEGLRNTSTREDLARAAHEGVVSGLLHGVTMLGAVGADVSGRRYLIGGGAKSEAYRQVVADLANSVAVVPESDEVVATGACVQAAAVLGQEFGLTSLAWRLGAGVEVAPSSG